MKFIEKIFISLVILTTAAQLPCFAEDRPVQTRDATTVVQEGPGSQGWNAILHAFESHDPEGRRFLEKAASQEPSLQQKLASLLLSLWEFPPHDPTLKLIRPITQPDLSTLGAASLPQFNIVVEVEVDAVGNVRRVRVLTPVTSEAQRAIVAAMKQTAFCPPFIDGRFKAGKSISRIHRHL